MKQSTEKTICDQCGEVVYKRAIHVENMHKYNTSSKEAYIHSLMTLENVTKEVATSWAEHGLYESCPEKQTYCHNCNNHLKTWRAKICLKCGAKQNPKTTYEQNTLQEVKLIRSRLLGQPKAVLRTFLAAPYLSRYA